MFPPYTQATTTSTPVVGSDGLSSEDPNSNVRWVHRRRMAYISLCSMVGFTAWLFSQSVDRITALADVTSWMYFAMTSIVGAYMGLATWSARQK